MDRADVRVFFRVDGNEEIGSGHFVRCRLLARALREAGALSSFVTSTPECMLVHELYDEGFDVLQVSKELASSSEALVGLLGHPDGTLVVVDDNREGFYTREFFESLRRHGFKVMLISFKPEFYDVVDVYLNQNLLALEYSFPTARDAHLLLGPHYAVMDSDFARLRSEDHKAPEDVRVIIVTFGGADRTQQSVKTIEALCRLATLPESVLLIVGGLFGNVLELQNLLKLRPELHVELHINTSRMAELMASSDLAVTSGGLTAWELACLGVPNAIVSTAEGERQTGLVLHDRGYAHYVGHYDEVSSVELAQDIQVLIQDRPRRQQMSLRCLELVDGHGTRRVVEHIKTLFERS